MTDTPPPERRFWQVHLSTVVMMTLAAGILGIANVYERRSGIAGKADVIVHYGFPLYATRTIRHVNGELDIGDDKAAALVEHLDAGGILWGGLLLNIAFGLVSVGGVAVAFEYLVRRRSKP
jgi:hypothetical protein